MAALSVTGIPEGSTFFNENDGLIYSLDGAGDWKVKATKLAAGTELVGKVSIDQVTANANEVKTKTGSLVGLEAGTNLVGSMSIDQTTDGTTNRVVAKISQTAGENLVQLSGSSIPNDEPVPTSIVGSLPKSEMELYGKTIATRPAANAVAVGTTFTVCNATLDTTISDGTDWVVV